MTTQRWLSRFLVRGVFWRQFLRWAVLNVPIWLEPAAIGFWSLLFLVWGPGRRGVLKNLSAIKPGSSPIVNFLRTYRVFWNYAWTITDNMRFKELHTLPDWEFEGLEHFTAMETDPSGAILITAHMGSYDLGAHLFAEMSERRIVTVRAPERDPQTRAWEAEAHKRAGAGGLRVGFNTETSDLAFELLEGVRNGEIVAIQGDRVTPGVASIEETLFGKSTRFPAGPFALAMTARARLHPVFVVRVGRRRYRLIAREPIPVERSSRQRDADLQRAVAIWRDGLEQTIERWWQQWFAFDPFFEETDH